MNSVCFRWLHITDLHAGHAGQNYLLPAVSQRFFDDLKALLKDSPIDAIFFTGDLTQSGSKSDFGRFDDFLNALTTNLEPLGSHPVFLSVPGNHDLQRPTAHKLSKDPALSILHNWHNQTPDVHDAFWAHSSHHARKAVSRMFANYVDWRTRTLSATMPKLDIRDGLLPGDFFCNLSQGPLSIGILGLNSTFLQLGDKDANGSDYQGRLIIHPNQFHATRDAGNGLAWANGHNVLFLLTHHPPDWLFPSSRNQLGLEVIAPAQFLLYLCGHNHTPSSTNVGINAGPIRRTHVARSLFGLETYGNGIKRLHGYSVGQITCVSDTEGILTYWHRADVRQGDARAIVPDHEFPLIERESRTRDDSFSFRRPVALSKTSGKSGPKDLPIHHQFPVLEYLKDVICYNQGKLAHHRYIAAQKHMLLKEAVQQNARGSKPETEAVKTKLHELEAALNDELDQIVERNFERLRAYFRHTHYRENQERLPRVSIKVIGEKDQSVRTLYRNAWTLQETGFCVNDNTGVKEVLTTQGYRYLENNIPERAGEGKYINPRLNADAAKSYWASAKTGNESDEAWMKCWENPGSGSLRRIEDCYRATLIIPMTLVNNRDALSTAFREHFHIPPPQKKIDSRAIFGLLCLDHSTAEYFSPADEQMGYIYADLLSLYLIDRMTFTNYSRTYREATNIVRET